MRVSKSVSITGEQNEFIQKHRYSPSNLLQEKIDELIMEYTIMKSTQCKPFVLLEHDIKEVLENEQKM